MCGLINKAGGRCLGGTGASPGGLGVWKRPHGHPANTNSSAPAWAAATSPTLPGKPFSTDRWLAWSPGEVSLMAVVKSLRKARVVLSSESVCKVGTDPALPESPGRVLGGGRSAPKETGWEARGEGES